jgi:hypothetical protein
MVSTFSLSWKNIAATPKPFKLRAGLYRLTAHAGTWGGGSVRLQRLAADGSTNATAFKTFSDDGSAIGARSHNIRDAIPEAVANIGETGLSTLIFDGIVQKPGDGHVF